MTSEWQRATSHYLTREVMSNEPPLRSALVIYLDSVPELPFSIVVVYVKCKVQGMQKG